MSQHPRRSSGVITLSLVTICLALWQPAAWAMGGHFEVDDAAVLDPERCQIELWALHSERLRLWHAGPSCRLGLAEWGLAFEKQSNDGSVLRSVGAQAKVVADAVLPGLDVGMSLGLARNAQRTTTSLTLPASWAAHERLQIHFNVGIDRIGRDGTTRRLGAAAAWSIDDAFSLLGERIRRFGETVSRLGLRRTLGEQTSIDLSGGRLSGGKAIWSVGLNHEFGR